MQILDRPAIAISCSRFAEPELLDQRAPVHVFRQVLWRGEIALQRKQWIEVGVLLTLLLALG